VFNFQERINSWPVLLAPQNSTFGHGNGSVKNCLSPFPSPKAGTLRGAPLISIHSNPVAFRKKSLLQPPHSKPTLITKPEDEVVWKRQQTVQKID
jgi:hypothetical protein